MQWGTPFGGSQVYQHIFVGFLLIVSMYLSLLQALTAFLPKVPLERTLLYHRYLWYGSKTIDNYTYLRQVHSSPYYTWLPPKGRL